MNHFKKQQIQNIADFNPREQLAKGALAKSVPMAMLKEFQRQITGYEIKAFNGGAKFRNGDTLLAKITPCLENGKTVFVDILDDGEVAFGSTEFIVLRAKNETNPEFLYYFAISPDFRKRAIECMEGTSGRQRVNENTLKTLELPIPEPQTQQSIAAVLSALDKKIALNKQINARLEEMAKTLYDYWFVQFDFPDANGKPYKSSGGEMVFDETLKREIPKGWEVKSLGEIATLKAGGDKPELISRFQTQEYKFPIYSNGLNDNALYGYCKKAIITEPSITISARGTIGFTKIRNHSFTPIIRLISVTPKNSQFIKFLELFLSQTSFENAGSVQKQLTIPQIENIKILTPNIKLINKFSDITTLSVGLIESNEKQNHQLTQLRDFLLPMLMNGQVSVVE